MQSEPDERLTAKDVARPYFLTSEAQIYEWARRGVFPPNVAFRVGRKLLFNRSELENWIRAGGSLGSLQTEAASV